MKDLMLEQNRRTASDTLKNLSEEIKKLSEGFDLRSLESMLNRALNIDPRFYLDILSPIKNISRKYILPPVHVENIFKLFTDVGEEVSLDKRIALANIIKYLAKKDLIKNYVPLLDLLKQDIAIETKVEVIWALAYIFQHLSDDIDPKLLQSIHSFFSAITSVPKQIEKKFFLGKKILFEVMDRFEKVEFDKQIATKRLKAKPNWVSNKVNRELVVTKNQQVSQMKAVKHQSEEEGMEILDALSTLRNIDRKRLDRRQGDRVPVIRRKQKSLMLWCRMLYQEVKVIYKAVTGKKTQQLSLKDLQYLEARFLVGKSNSSRLSPSNWHLVESHRLGALFVHRMIASSFKTLSERQDIQHSSIQMFINCLDNPKKLCAAILGTIDEDEIANGLAVVNVLEQQYNREEGDPLIVLTIANKIHKQMTCNEVSYSGGFRWIYNWMLKPTWSLTESNKAALVKIAYDEIENIRTDAIISLYHCAVRKPEILEAPVIKKLEACLEETNKDIRRYACRILQLSGANDLNHDVVFPLNISNIKEGVLEREELPDVLNYIYRQAQLSSQHHLFTKTALETISGLLESELLNSEGKHFCIDILKNYLYLSSQVFSDTTIKSILQFLNALGDKDSKAVKCDAVNLLLLYAKLCIKRDSEESKPVLLSIYESLVTLDGDTSNLLLLSMDYFPADLIKLDDFVKFSSKLTDDRVAVEENGEIQFIDVAPEEKTITPISYMATKLLFQQLVKGIRLGPDLVEALSKALNSQWKQTRILSAKILFLSEADCFSDNILMRVRNCIDDPVHDVSVYARMIFSSVLHRLSQEKEPLPKSYLEDISQIYAFEPLRIEGDEYAPTLNQLILNLLDSEANKNSYFPNSLFQIFDYILVSREGNRTLCLDILIKYTKSCSVHIPLSTVQALEKVLMEGQYNEKVRCIFSQLLINQQPVPESVLFQFRDEVYHAGNCSVAADALEKAVDLQDIPESIFTTTVLFQAGKALVQSNSYEEKTAAATYILKAVSRGECLPWNTLVALEFILDNQDVWEIYKKILNNGQCIPCSTLEKLSLFDDYPLEVLNIFHGTLRNNQEIPKEVYTKLEKGLSSKKQFSNTLPIFSLRARKGVALSFPIQEKISNAYITEQDVYLKQDYLSGILSLIQQGKLLDRVGAKEVIFKALSDENDKLIEDGLLGLSFLKENTEFSETDVNALITCLSTLNESHRAELLSLLETLTLKKSQSDQIKMVRLAEEPNDQIYVEKMREYSEENVLLPTHFNRLHKILRKSDFLEVEILQILLSCSNVPSDILHTIEHFIEMRSEGSFVNLCKKILSESMEENYKDNQYAELISEPVKSNKLIIDPSVVLWDLVNRFVRANSLSMRVEILEKFVELTKENPHSITPDIINIFEENLSDKSPKLRRLCFDGLNYLRQSKIDSSVFDNYCNRLMEYLLEEAKYTAKSSARHTIGSGHVSLFQQSENDTSYDRKAYRIEEYDLFRQITSLNYINFTSLACHLESEWTRILILSNFSEEWSLSSSEKLTLMQSWLTVEEKHLQDKSDELLTLLHENTDLNYTEFLNAAFFISQLSFSERDNFLKERDPSQITYENLITDLAYYRLSEKISEKIRASYIRKNAQMICSTFSVSFVNQLLNLIESIDDINAFFQIGLFLQEQKIPLHLLELKPDVTELKKEVEYISLTQIFGRKNRHTIRKLLSSDWTYEQLNTFFSYIQEGPGNISAERKALLSSVLKMLSDYKISSRHIDTIKNGW